MRVFECSQLEQETFSDSYQVSKSLIRDGGAADEILPPGSLHSSGSPDLLTRAKENLRMWQMFVCCPLLDKCQCEVSSFSLYIVPGRPACYDPSNYQEAKVENINSGVRSVAKDNISRDDD